MMKMKNIFPGLLLTLLLSWAAHAQTLQDEGRILQINNRMINVNDAAYALLPTTKVIRTDNKRGKLSDLKVGGNARVTLVTIGNKRFVDTIQIVNRVRANEPLLKRE